MSTKWLIPTLLVCLMVGGPLSAQQGQVVQVINHEYEIKAKYLYYLASFVTPQNAEAAAAGDLVIAVIGPSSQLFQEVNKNSAFRSLRERRVEWRAYATVSDFTTAFPAGTAALPRVVFLATPPANQSLDEIARQVTEHLAGQPVLIVTEDNEQFRKTVAVNIFEDKSVNRLKMQLRQSSLKDRRLNAADGLLKSAAVMLY